MESNINPSRGSITDTRKAHDSADTDAERDSIHHTIGKSPNQAAAGNHDHDDLSSDIAALDTRLDADEITIAANSASNTAQDATLAGHTTTLVDLIDHKPQLVFKTVDEDVVSSAVLQNDNELFFNMLPGAWMEFTFYLFIRPIAGAANGDILIQPVASAGIVAWSANGPSAAGLTTGTASEGEWFGRPSGGSLSYGVSPNSVNPTTLIVTGVCNNAAAATLNLKWAQSVSNANGTRILAGSYCIARKVN